MRVLDANGQCTVSTVISAINWVINRAWKTNVRVINLSLGHMPGESYTTDPLCQEVEKAWDAGIVVVCAAGNQGRLNNAQTTAGRPTRAGAPPTAPSTPPATTPTSSPSAP